MARSDAGHKHILQADQRLWHCDMWQEGFSDMEYAGGMENDVTGRLYNNYIITYYIYYNIYNK
jgi:hypothetical protein